MRKRARLTQVQVNELQGYADKTNSIQELKRMQAILLLNSFEEQSKISLLTGYSRSQAFSLRMRYVTHGLDVLKTKRKGEPKRLLKKRQLDEVINLLQTTTPPAHGYTSPFWTTSILTALIEEKYQVLYRSKTSYYVIFRKSRFSFHIPGRVSVRRNEQEVRKWRKEAQKKIEQAWRDPAAVILCEDEAILSTQTTFQKIWLPTNEYPKVEMSVHRRNRSIYGFLNLKTGKEHAFVFERQNMYTTVKALQKIRSIYPRNNNKGNKLKGKKIVLLWDNPGWHRGSRVSQYIQNDGKITLIYFPVYAPEENPQEHVWKKAKGEIIHNRLIEHIGPITDEFLSYLNGRNFFYSLLGYSPIS